MPLALLRWQSGRWKAAVLLSSCLAAGCLALAACNFPGLTPAPPSPPPALLPPQATETQVLAPPDSAAPSPTPTPTPEPSPTPAPVVRQLTSGGCCTNPFWSADGESVLFVDRPAPDGTAGIWGVGLAGGPPALVTERLGLYSPDGRLLAYPQNGVTVIERPADGQSWIVDNGARPVAFSPDSTRLAWTGGQSGPPFDTARRVIWTSLADGSQARALLTVFGGGLAGWLSDQTLLVTGRLQPTDEDSGLWILSIDGGEPAQLLRGPRLRRLLLSPEGGWLAHQVTFSDDPNGNGLWLLELDSGSRFRLDLFGAYRWRQEGRLLIIPLDTGAASHQLWEVDVERGALRALTDPADTPFKIANGDWRVSPDGRHIAFVSAADHNIWLMTLPPPQP